MNPFEGADVTGICDRLAMEAKRKRSVKANAVVLTYSLMDGGDIPWDKQKWQRKIQKLVFNILMYEAQAEISIRQLGPWVQRIEEMSVII